MLDQPRCLYHTRTGSSGTCIRLQSRLCHGHTQVHGFYDCHIWDRYYNGSCYCTSRRGISHHRFCSYCFHKKVWHDNNSSMKPLALDAQCLLLGGYDLFDAFLSKIKHLVHLVTGKRLVFSGSLHLHEFTALSHNYIHIHINC